MTDSQREIARLDRLEVADEDTVERVARAMEDSCKNRGLCSWEHLARAAIAELAAPGTDGSGQAVQRVLALADDLEQNMGALISHAGAARHIRRAVAGPQRDHDEEGGR